ncbi:imm11 family protein [Archangium sp.]|uniref:imm11 family protein n=1 Tax=Archangium sp. TaxID=1872627 RepID=UPI002D731790|nr:DUF1629 domain-containing protein [Archangium sp.]HYO55691.1 DUF1629 domain-containing protein [Archangium sp.]
MNKWTFHILQDSDDDRFCSIKHDPDTVTQSWRLHEGLPMGTHFPPAAKYRMDKRAGNIAPDFLPNSLSYLMISPKVRTLLEKAEVGGVEYLPFVLQDIRGKIISRDYCVANPLGGVDCLDAERSKFEMSAMEPDQIFALYKLNLRIDKIPTDIKLFRLKQMLTTYIIRSDLLELLRTEGITGFTTLDLDADIIL